MAGERRLISIKALLEQMQINLSPVQLQEPLTIDGSINIAAIPALTAVITSMPSLTIQDIVNLNIDSMPAINIASFPSPINVTTIEGTTPRTPSQTSVLVSNTSITVLAANPNRKWLYFRNYSGATANPIFLHFAASPATTTNGVPIVADEIYMMPEGIVYTGEVRAISSSAANKELYIEEWT